MPSLTIKIGHIEVAYEGEQKFIETGLVEFVKALADLPVAALPQAPLIPVSPNGQGGASNASGAASSTGLGHTTTQIAHSTSASTGPELALAAAAHLTLVQGQATVRRADILSEMKGASAFYKETYGKNLTVALDSLVKTKRLNPVSPNVYSLPAAVRNEFEPKLAS